MLSIIATTKSNRKASCACDMKDTFAFVIAMEQADYIKEYKIIDQDGNTVQDITKFGWGHTAFKKFVNQFEAERTAPSAE